MPPADLAAVVDIHLHDAFYGILRPVGGFGLVVKVPQEVLIGFVGTFTGAGGRGADQGLQIAVVMRGVSDGASDLRDGIAVDGDRQHVALRRGGTNVDRFTRLFDV